MPENGKRKSGEKARMGLQIDAMKEIEELKSEILTESSAGRGTRERSRFHQESR